MSGGARGVGGMVLASVRRGERSYEDCRTRYCAICRALREVTGEDSGA